jgi:hypothetical protein
MLDFVICLGGNMELSMNLAGDKPVTLGSLKPGAFSLFCFTDSADTPEDLLTALNEGGQNCYIVFVGDGKKGEGVDIVSLDGKQVRRMNPNRLVTKIPCTPKSFGWVADTARSRMSNVENGKVVAFPPPAKNVDDTGTAFLKIQGNPNPPGKVILVSLEDGEKIIVDDDLLVQAGTASVCINLRYRL